MEAIESTPLTEQVADLVRRSTFGRIRNLEVAPGRPGDVAGRSAPRADRRRGGGAATPLIRPEGLSKTWASRSVAGVGTPSAFLGDEGRDGPVATALAGGRRRDGR